MKRFQKAAASLLAALFACGPVMASGWEELRMSFSASTELPSAGPILRRQLVREENSSLIAFLPSTALPTHLVPNAYKRLSNGHLLLSFAHATSYPGAPRALYPGDVIEVDGGFSFHSIRLDALTTANFDRRININAVSVDPANPDHLLISLAHSATIGSEPYLPADIIRYDGSQFFLHFDGIPLAGRNINSLDAHASGGVEYLAVSFEAGGTLAGIRYSSSDILALAISGAGQSWFVFDRPGDRHTGIKGRLKLEALGVAFEAVPDRLFHDRFQE